MTFVNLTSVVQAIAAGSALLSPIVVAYARHEKKKSAKMNVLFSVLLGDEPTFQDPQPSPGLIQRLDFLEARLEDVQKQVTPNGGNTDRLGDRVVRLEQVLKMNTSLT